MFVASPIFLCLKGTTVLDCHEAMACVGEIVEEGGVLVWVEPRFEGLWAVDWEEGWGD